MKLCEGRHSRWLFDSFELSGLYRPADEISPNACFCSGFPSVTDPAECSIHCKTREFLVRTEMSKKFARERDFSVKFHRSILGEDFSTPDTLMQPWHRSETPGTEAGNPTSVNGGKFETYQAGGTRFFSTERSHRLVNARRREIDSRAFRVSGKCY